MYHAIHIFVTCDNHKKLKSVVLLTPLDYGLKKIKYISHIRIEKVLRECIYSANN